MLALPALVFNLSASSVSHTSSSSTASSAVYLGGVDHTMLGALGVDLQLNATSDTIAVFGRSDWVLHKWVVGWIIALCDAVGCVMLWYFIAAERSAICRTALAYRTHELTTVHFTVQVVGLPTHFDDRHALREYVCRSVSV